MDDYAQFAPSSPLSPPSVISHSSEPASFTGSSLSPQQIGTSVQAVADVSSTSVQTEPETPVAQKTRRKRRFPSSQLPERIRRDTLPGKLWHEALDVLCQDRMVSRPLTSLEIMHLASLREITLTGEEDDTVKDIRNRFKVRWRELNRQRRRAAKDH